MHHRSHDQGGVYRGGCCVHPGGAGVCIQGEVGRPHSLKALRDMVNKRAVRILLQCILVVDTCADSDTDSWGGCYN